MKLQLKAYGRVDLDGTHRAVIECNSPEFGPLLGADKNKPIFLKLQNGGRACGCILSEAKHSSANKIYLDQFKQRHLQVKDGDLVDIEEFQPVPAQNITLKVPPDFLKTDTARFIGKPVAKGEKTAVYAFSGESRLIIIDDVKPASLVVIGPGTEITLSDTDDIKEAPVSYKDVGGLAREIKLIREIVEYPFRYPELFEHLGVSQPRGIILHGPPGTGKTLIAKALASETGAAFYSISGPEIYSMWYGKSEENLRNVFGEACKNAPAVVVVDELDALAPRREKAHGDQEQRIVATFLTQMDGLKSLKGVVIIGTTNRINAIDSALRRAGRFEYEIHVGVPDATGRKEILKIHARRMPLNADVNLDFIAERTVGFVGADIAALCRMAAYNALRRAFPPEAFEKGKLITHDKLTVGQIDFENAIKNIAPSAMKEFFVEIPKVSWDDIGGLEDVKRLLVENISYAITKREVFEKIGVKTARGILLYGPPGTGKTLLAKAVATQCGANFISIKGPEIRSKWFGESEERIRFIFSKAREVTPCVIFFDEIDAAVPARGKDASGLTDTIVNQILSEMDGIENADGVFVIGATNMLELIDPAVLRPGRFDYQIEIPLPDPKARKLIFEINLKGKPLAQNVDIDELVKLTNGFSGAEIAEACREGIWEALRDGKFEAEKVKITKNHINNAIANIKKNKDKFKPKVIGFKQAEPEKE